MIVLASCNEFLDTLPDKRAELNTPQKIAQMLVSAYSTETPVMMFELMSDNTNDNGPTYDFYVPQQRDFYLYRPTPEVDWDVPQRVWEVTYSAIASANQALEAIEELGDPEETQSSKAEALLCRAYGHFLLVNTFSIAYNPVSSGTDLGIPYITAPETTVSPQYERKTVEYVYEMIDRDIEAALPFAGDNYSQPKYHFNKKAAYAFAARFNLYYGKWDKAARYATEAVGDNPTAQFRDMAHMQSLTIPDDMTYAYIDKDAACNLLIMAQRSLWGRVYGTLSASRYAHNREKIFHTCWQYFPWGNRISLNLYGNNQIARFPKMEEIFEIVNATAQTGQPHTVLVPFTVEETLMCRAEANVMMEKYDEAMRDLNYWYAYYSGANRTFSANDVAFFYSAERRLNDGTVVVPHPEMKSRFNIQEGEQENLIRAILAVRRLETIHAGLRWLDVKRHGIVVKHPVVGGDTITIAPYDPRTAVQLPQDVISVGMEKNPLPDMNAANEDNNEKIVDDLK
jgi:hypothetical protein